MAVAAHPAERTGRVAHHERVVGDVARHHAPRRHEAVAPERDAAHDGGIGADRRPAPEPGRLVEPLPVHLAAGVGHVCQHAARPEEHVVLDHGPSVDRDVVLDLDVVSDDDVVADIHVLPQRAAPPDAGARLNVAEVPDGRALPDVGGGVDVGALVDAHAGEAENPLAHWAMTSTVRVPWWTNGWAPEVGMRGVAWRIEWTSSMAGRASAIPKPSPAIVRS